MLAKLPKERQALLDAAAYIEENGWCQGALSRDGRVCALGGLDRVTDDAGTYLNAVFRLRQVLPCAAAHWNDRAGRTKQEVVDALCKAALHGL